MLAKTADRLADLTGMGEAIFGALFLGSTTSAPGIITSTVAAYDNHPELAMSNAIGGIAAQTFFLSIADISYPKINLEHAAASFANLMQNTLLILMLALVLMGSFGPDVTIYHIHPASLLLLAVYVAGMRLITKAKNFPMWSPKRTLETVRDEPQAENLKQLNVRKVVLKFVILAVVVAVAGYFIAQSGIAIAQQTGLGESFVGMLLTAVGTSLPELIVSIAAIRARALTLAVGNIIGGNAFDVLFVAFADMAFLEGSILHAVTERQVLLISLTIVMSTTLLLGLLYREKEGFGKIGWESLAIIILYVFGSWLVNM